MLAAAAMLPDAPRVVVYKNNSDGKGNSYGCHENYLMDRNVPFAKVVAGIVPHFVTRQLYAGAGKVGVRDAGPGPRRPCTSRSPSGPSSSRRSSASRPRSSGPIVNTRDEPHADPSRFRRLHVIVGDANLSEVATLLKVGTTAMVLAMVEDDAGPAPGPGPGRPGAGHAPRVDRPRPLTRPLELADGSTATALEIQWELFTAAPQYAEEQGLAVLGDDAVGHPGAGPLGVGAPRPRDRPESLAISWTGWPSTRSLRPTGTATAATGTTAGWPPWICSTTTCGPNARSTPGWAWNA